MSLRLAQSVWISLLLVGVGSVHAETPATLMEWIPADANAVAIVDVKSLFQTPLALRENLRQKLTDAFVNHELSVPPESKRVIFASQLGLSSQFQSEWDLGVIEFAQTPSFAAIARREGGQLDTLAGQSAIRLAHGTTAVELAPGVILGTTEQNRQVARLGLKSSRERYIRPTAATTRSDRMEPTARTRGQRPCASNRNAARSGPKKMPQPPRSASRNGSRSRTAWSRSAAS